MLKNPKYLYGARNSQIPSDLNYGAFMLDKMMSYGDKTAFINGETDERITYCTLAQRAANLAISLARMGVGKGDTVAICSENRTEFWSTVVGVMCTGAVLSTINMGYTKDELTHVMGIAKARYVFCSPLAYETHVKNFRNLRYIKRIVVFGDKTLPNTISFQDLVKENVDIKEFQAVDVEGHDTVMLLYSSGTTGLPKGVMLTHYNCLVSAAQPGGSTQLPDLIGLTITPWYHTMGLMGTLHGMSIGRTNVYLMRFDLKLYLECIQKYKAAILVLVPPVMVVLSKTELLEKYDVSSILVIYCGAAPLDLETINEVKKRFPNLLAVLQGYGMTETTLAVTRDTITPENPNNFKQGSVGTIAAGAVIKIVDLDTREVLGPNQTGEICVKGPVVMKGYVDKDRKDDFDSEGFFRTGDIGYYDEDKFVFIVDRLKELIKYKAYQVPPAELEATLMQHPEVMDAGVIGVPNKLAGEVPLAFVVRKSGSAVTEKQLVDFIASKLSSPKHLRGGVRFIDAVPKSASGKILRRKLKEIVKKKKSKL